MITDRKVFKCLIAGRFMARIINTLDTNLIKVNSTSEIRHLLDLRDCTSTRDLIRELKVQGITPYLGGSVVNGWLFNGEKVYQDIDILGVVGNVSSDQYRDFVSSFNLGKVQFGSSGFNVVSSQLCGGDYCGCSVDHKFVLRPNRRFLGLLKKADIDLSLVGKNKFEMAMGTRIGSGYFFRPFS